MIGIDFGTTNSAIAHVLIGGETAPLPDPITNEKILPSFVYYQTPDLVIVGKEVKDRYYELAGDPNTPIFRSIKRKLKDHWTYDVYGTPVRDVEIASHIFSELKNRAKQILKKDISSAVVTIPVYFDAVQRKAIRRAAELAGIQISGFLHEPVAVAYKFCRSINYTQRLLVIDWGGGTLDISIIKVDEGMISEIEIGGNDQLGGDDIDEKIATDIFKKFLSDNQFSACVLDDHPTCYQRLISRSESAKILLSDPEIDDASIDIPNFYQDKDLMHRMTRTDFERVNNGIFHQAIQHVTDTLQKVKLIPRDIDQVVLAGGSSRIPYLIKMIEVMFGAAKIRTLLNPDTAVAEGAAFISYNSFDPVLSIPIGIEFEDGFIHKFLDKGTSLRSPYKDQIQLFVPDPRTGTANIKIFESESGNPNMQDTRIKDILVVPVNPNRAEYVLVEFELDENQCLNIKATGMETGQEKECKIKDLKLGFKLN